MLIPKQCKIIEAASTDSTRSSINRPYLDVEKKLLIATDGRIMAMLPVATGPNDVDGFIDVEAIKLATTHSKGQEEIFLHCPEGELKTHDGLSLPRTTESDAGKFPNWKQVLPDSPAKPFKFSFDVFLLAKLAKALGAGKTRNLDKQGQVTLTVDVADDRAPITITCGNGPSGNSGVIMPMRIN